MSPRQDDFILRIIEQLGAALRHIRELLSRDLPAAAEEALNAIQIAQVSLLGGRGGILEQLDAATAVSLLGDRQQLADWIDLLRLEAEASRQIGHLQRAENREKRALDLENAVLATEDHSGLAT
jgi:hypothetical protein